MPSSSSIKAGAAYIELYTKDSRLVKGLNRAAAKLKAFGDGVTAVGKRFIGLGTTIVTPLLGAAKVFADMGSDLVDMSQRTGVSVEALSELAFAAEQSGSDVETLEGSLKKMQKFLVTAAEGSQEANAALAQLGLSMADLSRLAPEDQFSLIADRLSQIQNPALRTAMAMEIFGKSGTKLMPLMQGGAKGIDDLRKQARDLGLTMSTEDAQAAEAFGDKLDALWKVLKRTVFTIGSTLAPLLTQVADAIMRAAKTTSDWIGRNKGLVVAIFKVAAAVLAGGAALVVLGASISGLGVVLGGIATLVTTAGAAIGTLGTILASLLSPIGLVIGGVGALAAYIVYASGAGGDALAWLGDQFGILKDTALAAWKGIGDALAAGDLALAAKILWLTLKMEWQRGINFLEAKWLDFKGFFVGVWQKAVFSIASFMTDAWAGIQVAWLETTTVLANAWTDFIGLLKKGWNHFAGFFQKVWARIKGLFTDTNADEEIARINAEVAQQDQAINSQRDAKIAEREQARQKERERIEQDRVGAQGALDDMQAEEQRQREAKHQAALKESEDELAKARREWQDAIKDAADKRAEADAQGPQRLKRPTGELPTAEGLDELISDTRRKIDVVGSFNPLAARGLGADSLSERTAKATEQVAANTKQLVREAQHGGLVFALKEPALATIRERYDSREATEGVESPSVDLIYIVEGTEDDVAVRALVEATIPAIYVGLLFQTYHINHEGGGVWEVSVRYGKKEPKETGESSFSFDTGGVTAHITQSLATVSRHAPSGTAPDCQGAIGVTGDSVEGADITVPVYNFSETHYLDDGSVTGAYKAALFYLTGRVNNAPFKGFAPGEVLFLGASGSKRGAEDWEITYRFAASPNVTNLSVGPITGINKKGWEYLWVRYADAADQNVLVKQPIAAYVEQVYELGDFSTLGIGV